MTNEDSLDGINARQKSGQSQRSIIMVAPSKTPIEGEWEETPKQDLKESPSHPVEVGTSSTDEATTSDKGEEEKKKIPSVGLIELFRFADGKDRVLMLVGMLAACIHGTAMPLMIIVFGELMDTFIGNDQLSNFWSSYGANITAQYNVTADQLLANATLFQTVCTSLNLQTICSTFGNGVLATFDSKIHTFVIFFIILAACTFVVSYVQLTCFAMAGSRQTQRIRLKLFKSILNQEIGWFDTHEVGELNTRLTDDIMKIDDGIGERLSSFFQYVCAFLAGFVIGFVYGWQLTLVILSLAPIIVVCGALTSKLAASFTSKELSAYAMAGAVAEEVLGAMRTVVAFGGQEKEFQRYSSNLVQARKQGIKKGVVAGLTPGVTYFVVFCSYALAFWYGAKLTREDSAYTAGSIMIVFFSIVIGAFSLGNATPSLQYLSTARGAAHIIYSIIDHKPSIDNDSDEGLMPDHIDGNIRFKNVTFHYPSRPDVPILRGLDLEINVGETVALVGSSGCGKSTTIQLLQRFYEPIQGMVSIDGNDLRDLNVRWLREHIGVVSQEPVLFGTTIAENIRYGREGTTQAQIEQAARDANAHNFITKLPKGYETMVGERGAQLSGGQKQRIAIARALVRDPKILLLDEATSALDTTSEAIVQSALDKARMGRTTIIIAHRLSTIRNADLIFGFDKGVIAEKGSHEELMSAGGLYHTLVMNQTNKKENEDSGSDGNEEPEEMEDTIPVIERERTSIRKRQSGIESKEPQTEDEEEVALEDSVSVLRIMKLNKPETGAIIVGCCAALVAGSIQPVFAFIFASIISVFGEVDLQKQEQQVILYSCIFVAIGAGAFFGFLFQESALAYSGEMLTMRMREMAFRAVLRQEIGWFDMPENNVGALTTRLATDASIVKGATGSQLATVLRAIAAVIIGLTVGFVYSWNLTLVILLFTPISFLAGFIRMRLAAGHKDNQVQKSLENAGKVAIEAVENVRTVASLSKEPVFFNHYSELTAVPYRRKLRFVHLEGLAFGFSESMQFLINAAVFAYGASLIRDHGLPFENMLKVYSAIVFTAMALGQSSSFAPDYAKAKQAAARIFSIVDREPPIDSSSPEGRTLTGTKGVIRFEGVHFNYPNRKSVRVLQGLTLDAEPGQTVALVGSSGCGKSTSIQLLERFYDPAAGRVELDGCDLRDLNVQWMRSQISLVSQEPILFGCSIKDNIAYGDNNRDVPMEDIIAAAKDANIHAFISSLPNGYDTTVGDKGAQLSGGQKQRVAIARALIRNPRVLLLDEATSALDTESEKIVQEALDQARMGRTCIVIAHRLSTIRNADKIAVIDHGQVAEIGTHSELMFKEGLYYKLNNVQASQV